MERRKWKRRSLYSWLKYTQLLLWEFRWSIGVFSALVGMMKGPSGARIDFAVVFNGLGSTFDGVKAEDRLVEALSELSVVSADEVGPEAR